MAGSTEDNNVVGAADTSDDEDVNDDEHDSVDRSNVSNRCGCIPAAVAASNSKAIGSSPTSSRCGRSVAEAVP